MSARRSRATSSSSMHMQETTMLCMCKACSQMCQPGRDWAHWSYGTGPSAHSGSRNTGQQQQHGLGRLHLPVLLRLPGLAQQEGQRQHLTGICSSTSSSASSTSRCKGMRQQ